MNKRFIGHTELLLGLTRSVLRHNPHLLAAPHAIWMTEGIATLSHNKATSSVSYMYGLRQQKYIADGANNGT